MNFKYKGQQGGSRQFCVVAMVAVVECMHCCCRCRRRHHDHHRHTKLTASLRLLPFSTLLVLRSHTSHDLRQWMCMWPGFLSPAAAAHARDTRGSSGCAVLR